MAALALRRLVPSFCTSALLAVNISTCNVCISSKVIFQYRDISESLMSFSFCPLNKFSLIIRLIMDSEYQWCSTEPYNFILELLIVAQQKTSYPRCHKEEYINNKETQDIIPTGREWIHCCIFLTSSKLLSSFSLCWVCGICFLMAFGLFIDISHIQTIDLKL